MKCLIGDVHVHTGLSPCAEDEMTPNNIIRLAKLEGRDFLVISDHHSVGNVAVCQRVGKEHGIAVLPGMELETREEVHVLAIFPDLASAYETERWVEKRLLPVANRPQLFGNQLLFDDSDQIVGQKEVLLAQSLPDPLELVTAQLKKVGALVVPAHIDRRSHGLLGQLGVVPPDLIADGMEVGDAAKLADLKRRFPDLEGCSWVKGSDAHWLAALITCWVTVFWGREPTFQELAKALAKKDGRWVNVQQI